MNSKNGTKTARDIEASYHSFMNEPLSALKENVAGEFVRIVRMSEWVQIAFIRHDDEIVIEVEVSLPVYACGEPHRDTSNQLELLQGMMSHLLYIKDLVELGFTLSIIREDCLWVASYLAKEKPSSNVFNAIEPPTENQW
jgi:hypothetical protein